MTWRLGRGTWGGTVLAAAGIMVLSSTGIGNAGDATVQGIPPVFKRYNLVDIETAEIEEKVARSIPFTVDTGQGRIAISLWETELFADPSAKPAGIRTYEGTVLGMNNTTVRLSSYQGLVSGYVALRHDDVWAFEPLARYDGTVPVSKHLVYKPEWMNPGVSSNASNCQNCSMGISRSSPLENSESPPSVDIIGADQVLGNPPENRSGKYKDPLYRLLKLGIYAQQEYINSYSDWSYRLTTIVNNANGVYMGDPGLRFEIYDGPRLATTPPGGWSTDGATLLGQFKNWCAGDATCSNQGNVEMRFLAVGNNVVGLMGMADIGGIYGWGKFNSANSDYYKYLVFTHETGHNFRGEHGFASSWWDAGCGCTKSTIMYNPVSENTQMYFTATNYKVIRADSRSPQPTAAKKSENFISYLGQSATNSHGLQVRNWKVLYPKLGAVNSVVRARYDLYNTNSYQVNFDYAFLGCRNPSNCDYGWSGGFGLGAYSTWYYPKYFNGNDWMDRSFSSGALWDVWPAYLRSASSGGGYGPYYWEAVSVPIQASNYLPPYAGPDTSGAGVELTGWTIRSPRVGVDPKVGDTLTFYYTYKNVRGDGADLDFDPYGVFVACLTPSDANCDFGHVKMRLRHWNTGNVQGGYTMLVVTKVMTITGWWEFWPAYYVNGGWGPYRWHKFDVWISP